MALRRLRAAAAPHVQSTLKGPAPGKGKKKVKKFEFVNYVHQITFMDMIRRTGRRGKNQTQFEPSGDVA